MNRRSAKLMYLAGLVLAVAFLSVLVVALAGGAGSAAAGKAGPAGEGGPPTPGQAKGAPKPGVPAMAGTIVPLTEGFEQGFGAFTSFSIGCATTHCLWGPVTTDHHTGAKSVFATDVAEVGDDNLVLVPALAIPANATSASLTFWQRYGFEYNDTSYFDGGVIEVSTDGGTSWADAGANITSGGYNGTIATGYGNPLAGRAAWGGSTSTNWDQVQVNLMPYRGPSFRFRLRLGTDSSNATGATGWWVDDVQASYEAPLASCGRAWTTASSYPAAVYGQAVVSLGGLLYSFGGHTTSYTIDSSYTFDPGTNTWTPIASLPSARVNASAVTDGTYIYIVGGANGANIATSTLWRYDPTTNSYLTLAQFTTATSDQGAVYLNGIIYRIAGLYDLTNDYSTNTVEAYTIATNTWAPAANYPLALAGLAVLPLNGYFYTAGGAEYTGPTTKAYRFDPGSNTWDDGPIADLPGGTVYIASALYNDQWILASASTSPNANALAWDPSTNNWLSLDQMPQAVGDGGGGVVGGAFYVVGGYNAVYGPVDTVQKYVETSCATPSPTPASSTPTPRGPTPTVCPLQFSDVPPGSPFYGNIRCLACRGFINGYPDGTFKPNNDVSRGELAKIVSNTAGFNDPQTVQHFQDVAPNSTFFAFIGRLDSRGFMSGYACGGPGEPCVPPANLPYFRPGSNATRGQISKIVSNTAGFSDLQTTQIFEDVPLGSTFHDFIDRLASRDIMGGYQCGEQGEPCNPPGNLPYFRPNNNATRGQTPKIVGNTFIPDCGTP